MANKVTLNKNGKVIILSNGKAAKMVGSLDTPLVKDVYVDSSFTLQWTAPTQAEVNEALADYISYAPVVDGYKIIITRGSQTWTVSTTDTHYAVPQFISASNPIVFNIYTRIRLTGITGAQYIYVYDWSITIFDTMSMTMSTVALGVKDNYVYILGGSINGSRSSVIYKYDMTNKNMTQLSVALATSMNSMMYATVGTKIYMFGGWVGSTTNIIQVFDMSNETIETLTTTLPEASYNTGCAAYGTDIYIFGGYTGSVQYQTIKKFDTLSDTITTISTQLEAVGNNMSACTYGDYIYLFGGFYNDAVNWISKFNPSSGSLTRITTVLPAVMYANCAIAYKEAIIIIGGYPRNWTDGPLNSIILFDPSSETVTTLPTRLIDPVAYTRAVVYNDAIFTFGGRLINNANTADIQQITKG